MYTPIASHVLVSGGAGYIGSHVAHVLRAHGFTPIVLDSFVNGHAWAVRGHFCRCDIGDTQAVRALVRVFRPVAAMHFAAFIEGGESVLNPEKYFVNNRDKAKSFFDALACEGLRPPLPHGIAARITHKPSLAEFRRTRGRRSNVGPLSASSTKAAASGFLHSAATED